MTLPQTKLHHQPLSVHDWNAYLIKYSDMTKAAYISGQKEMRERAAVLCIESMKSYRSGSTHLGLGDIRLTIGAQEEIADSIRALKIEGEKS